MKKTIALLALICASVLAQAAIVTAPVTHRKAAAAAHRGPVYQKRHKDAAAAAKPRSSAVRRSSALLAVPPENFQLFTAPLLASGGSVYYMPVIGDFNSDGKKDLATMVYGSDGITSSIAVIMNAGSGSFSAPVLTTCTVGYTDLMLAGDLNGDHFDDLVLVHNASLEVFLGAGDGTFQPPVSYRFGEGRPVAAALADVNGDTNLDVLVADADGAQVATLAGNGDGTLQAATVAAYAGSFQHGVFADVNGDGKLDLVGATEVILANPAGGYFGSTALVTPDGEPSLCDDEDGNTAVGDLNGDGFPDIATADCWNNNITTFLNAGDGTFLQGVYSWAGFFPVAVSVADMDGDGRMDLVAANNSSGDITVLLGLGDGTFKPLSGGYAGEGWLWTKPGLADFDGDGMLDVIVGAYVSDVNYDLVYMRGFGDGTLAAARNSYGPAPSGGGVNYGMILAEADLNGDGRPDFILGNAGGAGAGITVFLADSDGTLQAGVSYGSSGSLSYVATADFDNDGKMDVVASDGSTGDVLLFLGNGDGTLQAAISFATGSSAAYGLAVGDFDHDGLQDVAVATWPSGVSILLSDPTAGFHTAVNYASSVSAVELTAADLNGDGYLDLAVPQYASDLVSVMINNGNGTFSAGTELNLGYSFPGGIAAGDLNGDGKTDLAVAIDDTNADMGMGVALGNGDGTFQPLVLYPATTQVLNSVLPYPSEVSIADVNSDGSPDLVFTNSELGDIAVLFGNGDGTFSSPKEFRVSGYGYGVAVGDVNADGALDVVAASDDSSSVTVLLNQSGSNITLASSLNPTSLGDPLTLTATVSASVRGVSTAPTGIVTFLDGGVSIGTVTLASGQASLVTTELALGDHNLTVSYGGDSSFTGRTSATLVETITSGTGSTPDYALSADPTSATLSPGQSANFVITVTPSGGYTGNVTFSCGALPTNVSCSFSPSSANVVNGNPVTVNLTVTDSAISAHASPKRDPSRFSPIWAMLMSGLMGIVVTGATRRGRAIMWAAGALVVLTLLLTTGCGSSPAPVPLSVSQETHLVQISASSTGGASNHQINLLITLLQK